MLNARWAFQLVWDPKVINWILGYFGVSLIIVYGWNMNDVLLVEKVARKVISVFLVSIYISFTAGFTLISYSDLNDKSYVT